jgi:hypothetical protein
VFVAFEVIEHLSEPQRLLDRIHGRLLYSIPICDASEWHVRAYTVEDAEALIGGEIWYQSEEGDIAPRERAWFPARYVLGVWDAQMLTGTIPVDNSNQAHRIGLE